MQAKQGDSLFDDLDALSAKLSTRALTAGEAAEAVDTIFVARKEIFDLRESLRTLELWLRGTGEAAESEPGKLLKFSSVALLSHADAAREALNG